MPDCEAASFMIILDWILKSAGRSSNTISPNSRSKSAHSKAEPLSRDSAQAVRYNAAFKLHALGNAAQVVYHGLGARLQLTDVSAAKLRRLIDRVLNDPSCAARTKLRVREACQSRASVSRSCNSKKSFRVQCGFVGTHMKPDTDYAMLLGSLIDGAALFHENFSKTGRQFSNVALGPGATLSEVRHDRVRRTSGAHRDDGKRDRTSPRLDDA